MAIHIPDNATEATRELYAEASRLADRARSAAQAWVMAQREADEAEATAGGQTTRTVANRKADARRLEIVAVDADEDAQQAFERALAAHQAESRRVYALTFTGPDGYAEDLSGDLPSLAGQLAERGYGGPSLTVRDEQGSVRGWVSAHTWRAALPPPPPRGIDVRAAVART